MSFAAHGNWCGPGWSAGQWKDAKDLTEEDKSVPAIDALDEACKNHDIGIAEGDPLANKKFYKQATAAGYYGLTLSQFVKIGGPSLSNYLRGSEEMTVRGSKRKPETVIRPATVRRNPAMESIQEAIDDLNAGDITGETFVNAINSVEDNNEDFTTPARPTPIMAPTLTREDRPLRGERPSGSLTNLLNQVDNTNMDTEMAVVQRAAIGDGNEGGQRGNRETTVKYNARAEMGIFTETRTAYLPVTFFLSINNVRRTAPIPLRIRLDWPYNILKGNTLAKQEIVATGGSQSRTRGLSNDAVLNNERANADNTGTINSVDPGINKDQLTPFPCTIVGDTAKNNTNLTGVRFGSSGTISDSACIPAYRKWYAKMYEWAHNMETDYRITYFSGDQNESFQNMIVFEGMNCTSDNNTARIPEDDELQKAMHWPHLKTHRISGRTNEKSKRDYVISGTWRDNEQYAMKMVPNEEDQKTWTASSGSDLTDRLLNYREELNLLHYSDYDSTHTPGYYNVRVDLRYKVQFRDLSNVVRFFGSGNPATYSSDDCEQYPREAEIVNATLVTSVL